MFSIVSSKVSLCKISDSQQNYAVLKAMRRSGDTYIKNVIMKKMKSKVYVSFRIPLYCFLFNHDQKAGFMSWLDMSGFEKLTIPSQV